MSYDYDDFDDLYDDDDTDRSNVKISNSGKKITLLKAYSDDEFDADDFASTLVTIDASAVTHGIEIDGNRLANKIIGGSGKNKIDGDKGNDTLTGGKGNDIFIYEAGDGDDLISDYSSSDKIKISDGKISNAKVKGSDVILTVGSGSLTVKDAKGKSLSLIDSSGKSFSSVIGGSSSTDTSTGSTTKTLKLTNSSKATVKLESGVKIADASKRKQAIKITGNSSANTISGGSKNDTLYGGDGNDSLVGNAGNDKIHGGDGNDTLIGGKGNDSLWGNDDHNVFVYAKGDGKDVIFGFEDDDMLQITGTFSASYNRSKDEIYFKVGSTSKAVTLKNFDTSSFNVNGDIYRISGTKLIKK